MTDADAILKEMKPEELLGVIERLKNERDSEFKKITDEKASIETRLQQEKFALQTQLTEQTKKTVDAEAMVQNLSKHGIDTSKLPSIGDIAEVLGESPTYLQNLFNINPKGCVEFVEMKVSMGTDMLDRELKDAGIDINGEGIAANFNTMLEIKEKYPTALHVDEDFPKQYLLLVDKIIITKEHTEKVFDVIAKRSNLQDCARSMSVHYLLLASGKDDITPPIKTQEKVSQEQSSKLDEIMKNMEEMKKQNAELKARIDEKDTSAAEKEREEITKLANEELKKGDSEDTEKEEATSEEGDEEEDNIKKKKKRY